MSVGPSVRLSIFKIVPATKRFVGILLNLVLSFLYETVQHTQISENLRSNIHILYSLIYHCNAQKYAVITLSFRTAYVVAFTHHVWKLLVNYWKVVWSYSDL
jgi:hypothetical protein